MLGRKIFVLSSLAIVCTGLGSLGLYRALLDPKPVVLMRNEYPTIGNENARIEVVVFEDFLCRACRRFSMEVFPAIQTAYVDRDIAKYVMVPLAFSSHSREIANAALAVFYQTPKHYFAYIQELFLLLADRTLEFKDLIEAAAKFGDIDLAAFEKSVKTGRYDQELDHNFQVAKKAMKKNLRTPTIFINGYPMTDISFESISLKIDEILKGKEGR
jgi:protein-disulfide isomerase